MARTFEALAATLNRAAAALPGTTQRAVRQHAVALRDRVRRNASGRPGPKVITGDYVRSIQVEYGGGFGSMTATVATDEPRAARLEYGFYGTDSLGRNVNAPPYPHWRPAAEWSDEQFPEDISDAVKWALGDA